MAKPGDELVFAPLGGVGEIGMNLSIYGYGDPRKRTWLAVDLGVAFGGEDLPGIDLIMPDVAFLAEQRGSLVGIVLTHAHEDHFGAVCRQAAGRAGRARHPHQRGAARRAV
jgi:ribonuclease J